MTASRTRSAAAAASVHEHGWVTASVHATSVGRVRYVRCAGCGAWRVDADAETAAPPAAVSRVVV
ncbi:hypothetical protein AB0230_05505 [Microbacterium sp. NPDC089190]|uniref:hypothetical protein n=1 Tax=Microbacterium sp. NPDC089190 TaxID=3155063 RepID=UPI00344EC870